MCGLLKGNLLCVKSGETITIDYHCNSAIYYWLDDVIVVIVHKINFRSCLHMISYVFLVILLSLIIYFTIPLCSITI